MHAPETENAMDSKPMYSDVKGTIASSSDSVIAYKKQQMLSKDVIVKGWWRAPTTRTLWCLYTRSVISSRAWSRVEDHCRKQACIIWCRKKCFSQGYWSNFLLETEELTTWACTVVNAKTCLPHGSKKAVESPPGKKRINGHTVKYID